MKERIAIVFIAVALGLALTTIGFFIYQSTKVLPPDDTSQKQNNTSPTARPTPKDSVILTIDEPKNEAISDKRTIQIKGKTSAQNTIIASTNQEDVVATPTSEGTFSISITIDAGTNLVITRAITTSGQEKIDERVVTFSTEEF